jgi:ferredoxin
MIRVRFIGADGGVSEVRAEDGARLLDVAQAAGQPLEGTCDGDMACATCHVVIAADDFARLPPAREEEEDLLDLVPAASRTSRLACQVRLSAALDGLTVRVPG